MASAQILLPQLCNTTTKTNRFQYSRKKDQQFKWHKEQHRQQQQRHKQTEAPATETETKAEKESSDRKGFIANNRKQFAEHHHHTLSTQLSHNSSGDTNATTAAPDTITVSDVWEGRQKQSQSQQQQEQKQKQKQQQSQQESEWKYTRVQILWKTIPHNTPTKWCWSLFHPNCPPGAQNTAQTLQPSTTDDDAQASQQPKQQTQLQLQQKQSSSRIRHVGSRAHTNAGQQAIWRHASVHDVAPISGAVNAADADVQNNSNDKGELILLVDRSAATSAGEEGAPVPLHTTVKTEAAECSQVSTGIHRPTVVSTSISSGPNGCTVKQSRLSSSNAAATATYTNANSAKQRAAATLLPSSKERANHCKHTQTNQTKQTKQTIEATSTTKRQRKRPQEGASCAKVPRHTAKPGGDNHFSCQRVYEKCINSLMDLPKLTHALLSLVIILNMLPLYYAVASSAILDVSALKGGPNPNPVPHAWIPPLPVVAYLEPLPRPTKSPKCDQTFVSRIGGPQNGTFSAPLLHNHKNHSRQCLYTFLAGPGQRVEVIFTSYNLRGSPPDGSAVGELPACVHEYMDIYSEVQSSDPAELINSPFGGRYCGTIPPRRRISMYRAIAISFFTNKNVTHDLFEGTFRFINASEYEIGIPIAGSPCSYTITPSMSVNKSGTLISPTYPGAYPKDMSCTYQFLGETNQRVRLEFRDFDLFFGGPHCPFDYVKVYDGPDNSSALIGTYCGQQRNLVLYSSESSLFVHFYTLPRTANTQNRGFKGIYEFSESFVKLDFIRENDGIHIRGSECDQKILSKKESTGYVLSPNYPYPYIPKTVCRYFIYGMQDAQHLERVRLEFSAFNIPKVEHKDKGESNCTDGYLKIYLKGQETADAYDKFDYELCGNETQRVISDGPRLAMVFSSGELQGRGFKGKYTFETEYKIPGTAAPDGTCSFSYVSSSKKRGELNSPRYPSNYPSETNCSYLFIAEANEQVTLVFDHFKVKADGNANATAGAYGSGVCFEDWLEMYVVYRDNNDRFLGRYCGLTAPGPVESPRGAVGLRITLHTDQENVASGFKARYFFETAKPDIGDCGGNYSNEDSGIITSPNYPAGYKAPGRGMASMACNWIITARPGYKLSINFEQFSIEGDPANRGCPAAVMRLWVNVDSDQPPLELCGEKPPIEHWHYISTGQTARISFTTSDKTVGAQGFRIVWTEIQDSGPGPPSIGLLCESTYHFQCEIGYCISDKLRCDGVKNCGPGDDSDELFCITEAPEEDHGVLIIITLVVVSFLICLLCTLYHSRRKRRNHVRQLGLHRNARYDSQTSAAGLSSSRRHLQSGGSISGSLHGINSGNLIIPPAPHPPASMPPPPHICIAGVDMVGDMMEPLGVDVDLDDDDEDDEVQREIFINDVRFDEELLENNMANV